MSAAKLLYLPNNDVPLLSVTNTEAEENIIELLSKLIEIYPPSDVWSVSTVGGSSVGGFYCGRSGLVYLFMNLDKVKPGLEIKSRTPSEWAAIYLSGERP